MAAILPAVMRFNLPASPAAFRRIAEICGRPTDGLADAAAGALAVEAVEDLLDRAGVAHRLRDYGLLRDQIPRVADLSWGQIDDFLESNARPFGRQDVESILADAVLMRGLSTAARAMAISGRRAGATACTVPETSPNHPAAPAGDESVGTYPCQILISVYHSL